MTDQAQTKTCQMCCMSISADARKCPHCQHFQNRASMIMFHPVFSIIIAMAPLFIIMIMFSRYFGRGKDYHNYSGQIRVTESRIKFGKTRSGPSVSVIGTIKNTTRIPWDDIRFQVDFKNIEGELSDTGQKEGWYGYQIPPDESLSFKVTFRREFPETNYLSHVVKVVSAKDARAKW